ncbi:very-long-chain 3-oxoacyl-CoA reductase 1-like [Typha angustifolia]|uniref:very-long-chain 3-oxoacyl-CoA reductase 1-like n=1 Tax=Typha angustifolia TaxID=59011 RepID=UPI003C2C328B
MPSSLMDDLRFQPTWVLLLCSLGLFTLTRSFISLLRWVYSYFLRPPKQLIDYGSWAVVTGPTSGIGRAMAFELARKGLNLVLVSRNPDKLGEVSEAIWGVSPTTKIKIVVFDLSVDVKGGIFRLKGAIEGLDVGVLVNNAGVATPSAVFFHEVDVDAWVRMIKVNLESLTEIARVVLPGMLQRRRGAVVNIGSGSTVVMPSFPLYAVYAATKAYVAQLSKSLYHEYKDKGIDVQCQVPLFVATKMVSGLTEAKRRSVFVPSSSEYAQAAIRWIGHDALCMPNFIHFLQWWIASLVPEFIHDKLRLRVNLRQREIIKRLRTEARNAATHN